MPTRETQVRADPARRADPAGNQRMTAMTGAVLLVLFAAECLTLLNIGNFLTLHVFLGMLLLGPVGLKICSTLWRFTRYYTGSTAHVRKGPPAPLQRVTGPLVILTTVAVLGTGIMLAVEGPGNGSWGRLHHLSFFLWAAVMAIHLASYVPRLPGMLSGLLIADRGNNRLLLMDAAMHVVWRYPSPGLPRDPLRFYYPDDAFFMNHGTAIISNQEQNETIIELAYPSGRIIWSFGHPGHAGIAPGYLNEPDDAYLLKDGQVTVADAQNCRVLVINANRTVAHQIGTDGVCVHHQPASMGSPNGDTPLADGNLLISEINGSWVSEYTPSGRLVWTVRLRSATRPIRSSSARTGT